MPQKLPPPVRAQSALPPPSRLLLPRVRPTDSPSRSRPPRDTALEWLGLPLAFDVVHDHLDIEGYQMYAVEKWIVERNRPITVLTVYTGDPSHKITVTALAPSSSLSEKDAAAQWEQALLHLRRDASARPKQTPNGVLMATSLAYFRSDYTIVHIPHGNFLLAKDQLYTNINLLRMGCGGRSALTLKEPSDPTKERFISTYHIPEITLPCSLPLPLHHSSYPMSSEHLPLAPSQPISASSSFVSRDAHPGSPTRRPSHRRSHSHSSPKGSLSKATGSRPSIHIVGPTPTSSLRGDPGSGNTESLGPSTLALLGAHTKGKTKDLPFFNATVLELVRLVQVGLTLFGMYNVKEVLNSAGGMLLFDGLLCDVTVRGIERWITEIGEPRAGLEPAERIADPMFLSALLSLVLAMRNKLSALGYSNVTPKDPFLHPHAFALALSSYVSAIGTHTTQGHSPATSPSISPSTVSHHLPMSLLSATVTTPPYAAVAFLNPTMSPQPSSHNGSNPNSANATQLHLASVPAVLTKELVESIEATYSRRMASINASDDAPGISRAPGAGIVGVGNTGGSTPTLGLRDTGPGLGGSSSGMGVPRSQTRRKVKRVLKGKFEDLTSAVANAADRDYDDGHGDGGRDERGGSGLNGDEADGNLSVGSSGGQLLRDVGNLLLSGASGIAGTTGGTGGVASVWDANTDLKRFVGSIMEKEGKSKLGVRARRKKGGKGSESVDFGRGNLALGLVGTHSGMRSNTQLQWPTMHGERGAIVAMLWSGRVADVVALREWERERERAEVTGGTGSFSAFGIVSDGEEARSEGPGGRSTEGEDSDVQMEGRLGGSFGGVWSERMQRKLGNWAGLSKRKGPYSVEFGGGSIGRQGKAFSPSSRSPGSKIVEGKSTERAQSPTLHPGSGDLEEDDILPDSGQASPNSEYKHNPFTLEDADNRLKGTQLQFYDTSRGVSTAELGRSGSSNADNGLGNSKAPAQSTDALTSVSALAPAFELDTEKVKSYAGLRKRRWGKRPAHYQQRIASWSDTRSAWGDEGFWMSGSQGVGRRKKKRSTMGKAETTEEKEEADEDDTGQEGGAAAEAESDTDKRRGTKMLGVRRRSYHDLDSLRSLKVLSPERMKIDVELSAQVLIMVRREEHLQNVIACLETLTSTLYTSNSLLENDFELHKDAILEIDRRARVISEIDSQACQTDQITQAKNMLQYESAQFLISELWHTASLSRKKVFELREKVFGAGNRRLPPGKHGAHGRFNRVQWTLDGERRLVDYLGRTEEEAEEENRVDLGVSMHRPPPEDEEEDVIEHPGIKPMWLLRFFTSWGARWSTLRAGSAQVAGESG